MIVYDVVRWIVIVSIPLLRYHYPSGSLSNLQKHLFSLVVIIGISMTGVDALAQWQMIADGDSSQWVPDTTSTMDQQLIRMLHQQGYLYAVIDSVNMDSQKIFVSRGHQAQIGSVRLVGGQSVDLSMISVPLKRGDSITSHSLEKAAEAMLDQYSELGYVLAEVAIEAIIPIDSMRYEIVIRVREGMPVRVAQVMLRGAKRTKSAFVHHTSGLAPGQILKNFKPHEIQRKLEASGIFTHVGLPELYSDTDSSVIVHVPVIESPPGVFDIALGIERGQKGGSALIGSGSVALQNLFGGARTLELHLNRAPGQLGFAKVRAESPLLFGLPLSLSVSFEGLQQDSTYGKREYGAQFGYWVDSSMQIFSSVTRHATRPGFAGVELRQGIQRIAVSDALFFGGGINVLKVDHALSPTQGYRLSMHGQSGYKNADRMIESGDSLRQQRRDRQGRLMIQGRVYLPVFKRSLLVTGGEVMLLSSRQVDESDLFRIGGTQTLRGYDEHRFRASFASRIIVEYRYLLDRVTYGFGFVDLGYLHNRIESNFSNGWYPGLGVGFQIETAAGVINFTLASSTEDLSTVRAHIGLSLGI